jgi:hypothetical protein
MAIVDHKEAVSLQHQLLLSCGNVSSELATSFNFVKDKPEISMLRKFSDLKYWLNFYNF